MSAQEKAFTLLTDHFGPVIVLDPEGKCIGTVPNVSPAKLALVEEMFDALDGLVHFEDGVMRDGVLGKAFDGWLNAARSVVARARGETP